MIYVTNRNLYLLSAKGMILYIAVLFIFFVGGGEGGEGEENLKKKLDHKTLFHILVIIIKSGQYPNQRKFSYGTVLQNLVPLCACSNFIILGFLSQANV